VRRSIFAVLVGSNDCAEAFERLMRLPLKKTQTKEIIAVLVDCCAQEKT
jgi:nucleolar MIF4G domain-containing protein 1